MSRLSVIICAHNPSPAGLQRVLAALRAQTLDLGQWELLLIDNASSAPLVDRFRVDWHPNGRHVHEDKLGLTPARLRGIAEARSDVLLFVDDDNVLDPAYLDTAVTLLNEHPHLGAIGCGRLEAEYEVQPPAAVTPYLSTLSRSVSLPTWSNRMDDRASVPWGAGLCVTRDVAHAYVELLGRMGIDELLDRRGERLFGNGDVVFSWTAVRIGKGFGVFPQLRILHLVPARRVTRDYMLRFVEDCRFSCSVSEFLLTGQAPTVPPSRIETLVRLALRGLRRGPFASRMGWAEMRGSALATAFIESRGLQPLAHERSTAASSS